MNPLSFWFGLGGVIASCCDSKPSEVKLTLKGICFAEKFGNYEIMYGAKSDPSYHRINIKKGLVSEMNSTHCK